MRLQKKVGLALLLTSFFIGPVTHAQEEGEPKPTKLFKENSMLEVTLTAPWRTMERRKTDKPMVAGSLAYTDSDEQFHKFDVEFTTRGLTRLERVCDFPPLKIFFDKSQTKDTNFRGQSSLKMVTHCKMNSRYQQYYIKEYLSYRIYNLVTPYSFRVRPLMITYLDGADDKKPLVKFGFLIEDVDDLAERRDLVELEMPKVRYTRLDPVETAYYSVFQYLISNLDWSATGGRDPVECCHNTKLIGKGIDADPVFAIPYDLDSSGLVNTPYAAPPDGLRVKSVTQRLYRGFCFHNDEIPATVDRYREKKSEIIALFENEELLTKSSRITAIKFIEGFYKNLDKPDGIRKYLTDKCRG